jgi:hypothetical protein
MQQMLSFDASVYCMRELRFAARGRSVARQAGFSADQLNLGSNVRLEPFAIGGQRWNAEALRQS